MAFKLPKEFTPGYSTSQKPTCPVEIDWNNPTTNGLIISTGFNSGSLSNLVDGELCKKSSDTSNTRLAPFDGGISIVDANTTDGGYDLPNGMQKVDGLSELTIISSAMIYDYPASNAETDFIRITSATSTGVALSLANSHTSSSSLRFLVKTTGTGVWNAAQDVPFLFPFGRLCTFALTYNSSLGRLKWYAGEKGKPLTLYKNIPGLSGNVDIDNEAVLTISGGKHLATYGQDAFEYASVFNRAVSFTELKSLHQNPYQILKPKVETFYYPVIQEAVQQSVYPLALPKEFTPGYSTTKKPTCPVEIDWSNPLTEGLYDLYLFDNQHGFKSLRGEKVSHGSEVTFAPTYARTSNTSAGRLELQDLNLSDFKQATFIIAFSNVQNPDSAARIFSSAWGYLTSNDDVRIYRTGANTWVAAWDDGSTLNQTITTKGDAEHKVIAISTADGIQKTYYDGELIASGLEQFYFSGLANVTTINGLSSASSANMQADVEYLFVFNRGVTDSVVKALYDNPYQVLKPSIDTIYFSGVESGGVVIDISEETDSAFSITSDVSISISLGIETDTSNSIHVVKVRELLQALETDNANVFSSLKSILIGQSSESDIANAFSTSKTTTFGQANESDIAQLLNWFKTAIINTGIETDIAFATIASGATVIGQSLEADSATLFNYLKTIVFNPSYETDAALLINRIKNYQLNLANEFDSSFAVDHSLLRIIDQSIETDTAGIMSLELKYAINQAYETDSATVIDKSYLRRIGLSLEQDIANNFTTAGYVVIDTAEEIDTALSTVIGKLATINFATEADTANGIIISSVFINSVRFTVYISKSIRESVIIGKAIREDVEI